MADDPTVEVRDSEPDDEVALGELIDDLSVDETAPAQRGELKRVVRMMEERHSGPLPNPRYLKEYARIIPNGAERIMLMAESEQEHRHALDHAHQEIVRKVADYEYAITRRGQSFGLAICLAVLVVGVIFLVAGEALIGGTIIGADLVGLATVFVIGTRRAGTNRRAAVGESEPDTVA